MIVRDERPADAEAISTITRAAFRGHPHSQGTEAFIVAALRAAGALALSLVAELDGAVVGHVAVAPVILAGGPEDWFGVGPLSVAPAHQRKGIGARLMREAIGRIERAGAGGLVLVGDPAYYARFGFRAVPGLSHAGVPAEFVLALALRGEPPRGDARFHAAFTATA